MDSASPPDLASGQGKEGLLQWEGPGFWFPHSPLSKHRKAEPFSMQVSLWFGSKVNKSLPHFLESAEQETGSLNSIEAASLLKEGPWAQGRDI